MEKIDELFRFETLVIASQQQDSFDWCSFGVAQNPSDAKYKQLRYWVRFHLAVLASH